MSDRLIAENGAPNRRLGSVSSQDRDLTTSPAEVRSHLARVLASPEFSRARQLRLLLEFLVNQTLDGSCASLKEFTIATEALGRNASFNGGGDNIVRVEVRRLRQRLSEYYQQGGALEGIRIEIPKGTYVPHFVAQNPALRNEEQTVADYRSPMPASGEILNAAPAPNPSLTHRPEQRYPSLLRFLRSRFSRPATAVTLALAILIVTWVIDRH